MSQHLFWITSRAAGFAALILASLAVSMGLIMSLGYLKRTGGDRRTAHEILSLSAIVAVIVHAVSLLGDKYLHPSLADISVPFASGYHSAWTTLGIISGYSLSFLGLSYYARGRIGVARWRLMHRFTALAWLGGLAHSLGEGTDAGQLWFLAMIGIVAVPAALLLLGRLSQGQSTRWSNGSASSRSESAISPERDPSTRASGGGPTPPSRTMSSSFRRAA